MTTQISLDSIKVLAFDVFGTLVDWHSGVARAVDALNLSVDGDSFALAWRDAYQPALQRVITGELAWTLLDDLHRMILDDLLERHGITHLSEDDKCQLNTVWHRLDGWPDTVEGLTRLKRKYLICSLSNGNLSLLFNLARHAGLPFDCLLSAETFQAYKPDAKTYLGVARVFEVEPAQVLMVAAHQNDLTAARACAMQTAYIERPQEWGSNRVNTDRPDPSNTLRATRITDLATLLGC
ncbi:MAG: haloacid dehalogenase type II [Burkholderiaceae bacterium]|nr:haloacid dehalogenase type II [Burkholderiaceae bacterium]